MKLLLCYGCGDIFNLKTGVEKVCSCGITKGMYLDNINARFEGLAVPLCISNPSLTSAIQQQGFMDNYYPEEFLGRRFEAWVCPKSSDTFIKIGSDG